MPDPAQIPGSRAGDTAGATFARTVGAPATPDFNSVKESLGDLGKDKSFEPIKDFNGWAKTFVEGQKMIGSSIRLPKKDAKPEERQKAVGEITAKLRAEGILESPPESPDKYEIKFPTEDFKGNEPLITSFKAAAHKLELPPSKVQGVFDWYLNFQAEVQAQEQREFEETKAGLKKEFAGLYVRKMEAARRAMAKFVGEDGDELISNLPPKAGARLLKAFAEIGDPLLEEAMVAGEIPGVPSLEELRKKAAVMMADKTHPLNILHHPLHTQALKDYDKINDMIARMQKGGK